MVEFSAGWLHFENETIEYKVFFLKVTVFSRQILYYEARYSSSHTLVIPYYFFCHWEQRIGARPILFKVPHELRTTNGVD